MEIKLIYYNRLIATRMVSPTIASLYAGCTKLKERVDGSMMTFSVVEAILDYENETYELILEDV